MKTETSALYKRIESYRRGGTPWIGASAAVLFASLPLFVMLWVVPVTGIGIA